MLTKILILSANPDNTPRLHLDREVREIEEGLRRSLGRNSFVIDQKSAVRPADVIRAMIDYRPHIVHFAGHGVDKQGIVLEDNEGHPRIVTGDALSKLFEEFTEIECVILNACYTEKQGTAIAEHVGYVIGMSSEVSDKMALSFIGAFYDALGSGEPYSKAYKLGLAAIRMEGFLDESSPILIEGDYSQNVNDPYTKQLYESHRRDYEQKLQLARAAHQYADKVIKDILSQITRMQVSDDGKLRHDLTGRWQGMVNGRIQLIEIVQYASVIYIKGIASASSEAKEYQFRGEGRVVQNTLVFSWGINEISMGINVMSIMDEGKILDGKYFTSLGATGDEIYQLQEYDTEDEAIT